MVAVAAIGGVTLVVGTLFDFFALVCRKATVLAGEVQSVRRAWRALRGEGDEAADDDRVGERRGDVAASRPVRP
ncbi:hypothetical protein [Kitasatospora cheerisanensis]|uniref:hypothetical protein n=1 Tax=Kitasatospora cheerisanensis TaxID=81942 RepID=UPI0012EE1603|nr:hypothetical protein [Kitasatospora cheerisanensis]